LQSKFSDPHFSRKNSKMALQIRPIKWLSTDSEKYVRSVRSGFWTGFGQDLLGELGLEVSVLSSLPRNHNNPPAKCGCKKHYIDFHGDHAATCTAHTGATKAHNWLVGVLGPLFRTAGHTVHTQHSVTASAGQRRGDVQIRNYMRDQAGSRSLVFDLSITHDRYGSNSHVKQNGLSSHPQDLDAPLHLAAQRKINGHGQQYADNQNISFLPAIVSTSTRMHGELLRPLFIQAHRETEAHFAATGMSSQRNHSDSFRSSARHSTRLRLCTSMYAVHACITYITYVIAYGPCASHLRAP
jgi:hypothetical protein